MNLDDARLLAFAERLQSATDVAELLQISAGEIGDVIGYQTAWIAVFDLDNDTVRMLAATSENDVDVWGKAPVFPIANDPYMRRIVAATTPQVVVDAQTDPDVNRAIVESLGNRTIVNVPMWLMDQPFGALGTGSFGDEGVMIPSDEQLAYLRRMANQLVVASARIVLLRQRQEAAEKTVRMRRMLEHREKLAMLGQLAIGVAHDFNNLLTVIMASAEFLKSNESDQVRRDELTIVVDATQRASELTRRLLTLGQRQPLHLSDVAPERMLASLVDMIRRVIPADIEIELKFSQHLPGLVVDQHQLEQVITNLCLNARDAMPGGGTLSISCDVVEIGAQDLVEWPSSKPGTYIEIRVSDTGVGIPEEVQERIFEPLFTTKRADHGTGLGLAVCRGIVERHGGLIHVASELGTGTTFRVNIPTRATQAVEETAVDGAAHRGGSERILVADDQPYVRRAVERVLKYGGYEVTSVGDGSSAVEAARSEDFDLIILDVVMPKLGGRRVFEQIRTIRPNARFLFASGYGVEEVTARFMADTNVALLQKPFAADLLLKTVRRVLDASSAGP